MSELGIFYPSVPVENVYTFNGTLKKIMGNTEEAKGKTLYDIFTNYPNSIMRVKIMAENNAIACYATVIPYIPDDPSSDGIVLLYGAGGNTFQTIGFIFTAYLFGKEVPPTSPEENISVYNPRTMEVVGQLPTSLPVITTIYKIK